MGLTQGQQLALEQLRQIEAVNPQALEIVEIYTPEKNEQSFGVQISVDCTEASSNTATGGIQFRNRERLFLEIPANFPFDYPSVSTRHTRFAGHPHVQWSRSLCLYLAPSTEWNPSDGMFGFIERLAEWLEMGALNQLDPQGAPLHPPVAYVSSEPGTTIIPSVDVPVFDGPYWVGLAKAEKISERCIEIVEWTPISDAKKHSIVAAAILLSEPMPFEFPLTVKGLLKHFNERGIPWSVLLASLQFALIHTNENEPLFVIIGTPMRGIRGSQKKIQHLVAWWISPSITSGLRLSIVKYSQNPEIKKIGEKIEKIILDWAESAVAKWCPIRENRPEAVNRRDFSATISWFNNRSVALWGCGAIGAHLAEYLARAGVKKLVLVDKGVVSPGLLVRQPFEIKDMGTYKVVALERRLKQINLDLEIEPIPIDLITEIAGLSATRQVDLIIDSSANATVSQFLELKRKQLGINIPISSMIISHDARRGIATIAQPNHTGGIEDVYRKAKLSACNQLELKPWLDSFWPSQPRSNLFQPEPGCSDATFVGSQADVSVLAGTMLNFLSTVLAKNTSATASAHFVSNSIAQTSSDNTLNKSLEWCPDQIVPDPHAKFEVRISQTAWDDISGWIERSQRRNGPKAETGGILFGEINDAANVIWIDEVLGAPPDSVESVQKFICGTSGVDQANHEKKNRTRRSVAYLGLWHTHPDQFPLPSATDIGTMASLAMKSDPPHPRTLMLIIGNTLSDPILGAFLFKRSDFQKLKKVGVQDRPCAIVAATTQKNPKKIGLALSGGGSRAIAFHLGCLRALHDRGILNQIEVVSSVSGGSVIAAMYAYSHDSFQDFEKRVENLLKKGLTRSIVRRWLFSPRIIGCLATCIVSGIPARAADAARILASFVSGLTPHLKRPEWIDNIQPPFRRWISRTNAFELALSDLLFDKTMITDERRNGMNTVINSCDLTTGSAFRFGSKESACYRFGFISKNSVQVSRAVAASAAFPALLPALDLNILFDKKEITENKKRVLLTDGGVFDNLGLSCFDPTRNEKYSYNVYHPDYIICCSAGAGILSGDARHNWWPTRMSRSFNSIYRKFQDGGYGLLHQWRASGKIKGFILPYLGQQDIKLPWIPPELPERELVYKYPTDFSSMSQKDIDLLSTRGEVLTRYLLSAYCPEL